jgi:thiol-disulfide isomerase/thioredoxin
VSAIDRGGGHDAAVPVDAHTDAPRLPPLPAAPRPRPPWTYLVAAVSLAAIALGAVVVAARVEPGDVAGTVDPTDLPTGDPAPALDVEGWLNSPSLGPADLAGRVVVYDFWTYSCVNCVRTLPYLRAWWDRYRGDGLVIVGVHSPEFEFERDHDNVAGAVERLDVTWPVALDDHHATFDAFDNHWWPAKYVADRDGRIRYRHIGEGGYDETEDVLRELLGVDPASARAGTTGGAAAGQPPAEAITPETYLGTFRGRAGATLGERDYPEPGDLGIDEVALAGRWEADAERVRSLEAGAAIVLDYRAAEVNLVLAADGGGPLDVTVEVDGEPVPEAERPDGVHESAGGATVVTVTAPDLYRLVLHDSVGEHTVRLTATAPGVSAFAFTFGA